MIEEALKNPRDKDRFRIVDWLEADPASIMKHLNVVACIYHGGATSANRGKYGTELSWSAKVVGQDIRL